MGDYVKLIVNAEVKVSRSELEAKIDELDLCESAYHCGGLIRDLSSSTYRKHSDYTTLILIGQTKWGNRQAEFLDWLAPYVRDGSGPAEAWAIQFDEYSPEPILRCAKKDEVK